MKSQRPYLGGEQTLYASRRLGTEVSLTDGSLVRTPASSCSGMVTRIPPVAWALWSYIKSKRTDNTGTPRVSDLKQGETALMT